MLLTCWLSHAVTAAFFTIIFIDTAAPLYNFNATDDQLDRFADIGADFSSDCTTKTEYGVKPLKDSDINSFLSISKNYQHSEWVQNVYTTRNGVEHDEFRIIWQFSKKKSLVQRLEDAVAIGEEVDFIVIDTLLQSTVLAEYSGTWRFASSAFEPGALYAVKNVGVDSTCCLSVNGAAWGAASGEIDGSGSAPADFWGIGSFKGACSSGCCYQLFSPQAEAVYGTKVIDLIDSTVLRASRRRLLLPPTAVRTTMYLFNADNGRSGTGSQIDNPSPEDDNSPDNNGDGEDGADSGSNISMILIPTIFGFICLGCIAKCSLRKREVTPAETAACYVDEDNDCSFDCDYVGDAAAAPPVLVEVVVLSTTATDPATEEDEKNTDDDADDDVSLYATATTAAGKTRRKQVPVAAAVNFPRFSSLVHPI